MVKAVPTGLSLPSTMLKQIDDARGDIPRSRYIQRLIEKGQIATESKEAGKQ